MLLIEVIMLRKLHLRRFFMPFFIAFIMVAVALSMGSGSAQPTGFGNLSAMLDGYTEVCAGTTTGGVFEACPSFVALAAFSVPASLEFTALESVTVLISKDFFFGGAPYDFIAYAGEIERSGPVNVVFDEDYETTLGGRNFPVSPGLTADFTFTRAEFPRGFLFIPGQEYAIKLETSGFNELYAGWAHSEDTPPTGIFDYIGSFAGGGLVQFPVAEHVILNIEVSPATELTPSSINVVEGGGAVSASLTLKAYANLIQFPISADSQCEVSIDNVNFATSLNLPITTAPATFYVRAIDDGTVEGAHSCTVTTNTTSSGFGSYDVAMPGDQIPDLTVNITDNDTVNTPGSITLTQSGGTTVVTEGGATDSFTLRLDNSPTAPVQIAMLTNGQCSLSSNSLTFSSANYLTPQNVTVTAVNDTTFEINPHNCAISFSVTSSDSRYNGRPIPTLNAPVTDNDPAPPPGFITTQSGGTTVVSEGGATDSYTIHMTAPPTGGSVTIVTTTNDQCNVDVGSFSFNNGNYAIPQTFNVTPVNDADAEGNHTCTIYYDTQVGDPALTVNNTVVTVLDDDVAGFTLIESGGTTNVTEGGATDTFTVRLNTAPTQNVTLALSTNDQCGVDRPSITFNATNYNNVQTVTVSAANDSVFELSPHTCTIFYDLSTFDPAYMNAEVFNTLVYVTDFVLPPPPTAGITLTQSGGTTAIAEGGATDSFTLQLNSTPAAAVQIAVTTDAQCSADLTPLTFTTANAAQTVTLTAVDDAAQEASPHACAVSFTVTSTDGDYNGLTVAGFSVDVTDNDAPPPPTAGVTVTQSGGTTQIAEGGATDSFTLQLNSTPAAAVQIAVTTDAQCSADLTPLTFTTANAAQTVTLTAVDDAAQEASPHACAVSFTVTSTDGDYNGLTVAGFSVDVTDNDAPPPPTAGVTVTQSGGTTQIAEGGATDSFTLQLNSTPAAAVQIAVTTDAQCSADLTPLTFTMANAAQTVTLTAVDDGVQEASPHACAVSFTVTSTDGDYNGRVVAGFSADVNDNDAPPPPTAGVTVTQSGGTTQIAEGGATDTLALRLNSAPSDMVTIEMTTDGQCAVAPDLLTFDDTTYAADQDVTVSAVDDGVAETNPHNCVISYTVTSPDTAYDAFIIPATTVAVTDAGAPPPPGGGGQPAVSLLPPPPTPLCEDHNFSEGGVVRTGVADALRSALNCRVLYQNGAPTSWLGNDLYTSGAIGSEGVLALGVQQAIDIFSPTGLTYFNGGAVFCLRGNGYLIWLAASGMPRRAEIIGSYRVVEFPGFTCATLFEPGMLVLVSRLPEGVSAP
jgi:hypothetical protein